MMKCATCKKTITEEGYASTEFVTPYHHEIVCAECREVVGKKKAEERRKNMLSWARCTCGHLCGEHGKRSCSGKRWFDLFGSCPCKGFDGLRNELED